MLLLKFVQGLPVVGIFGGAANPVKTHICIAWADGPAGDYSITSFHIFYNASEWNYSAPHGAGRLMSRSKGKETLNMAFPQSMEGIYTTSVHESTIDEAPMAYKPMEAIVSNIHPTVEINSVIRPIYNFKRGYVVTIRKFQTVHTLFYTLPLNLFLFPWSSGL